MAKIVVKSEFHSGTGFILGVKDDGLVNAEDDYGSNYVELDEIPEFIARLQAEYDKQKAGN